MSSTTMDEALERIRGSSPELAVGGPNHGPMAADAMISLGAGESDVVRWVDAYRARLAPMPPPVQPITRENWREALGEHHRTCDWSAFFAGRLAEAAWQYVLREWLPELIPGLMAAGTHGLIRTAHAVRQLEAASTPLRVEELAAALGYWAAYYQELPGQPVLGGDLDVRAALQRMPRLGASYDPRDSLPREFLQLLSTLPDYPAGVTALAVPDSVPAALTALTGAAAQLYLANASRHPLVMLHTVTGPSALRMILPHLGPGLQRTAFAYVWQSVAAWVSAFSAENPPGGLPPADTTEADVIDACLEIRDVHAIKFGEACIREYRNDASPAYLEAAVDWASRLRQARGWSRERRMDAGIAVRA